MLAIHSLGLLLLTLGVSPAAGGDTAGLTFACAADNDLYRVVTAGEKGCARYDDPAAAVHAAPQATGVLLLADGYPRRFTQVDAAVWAEAGKKKLRLYVEFPAELPGIKLGSTRHPGWERVVVASDAFGPALQKMRILAIHNCAYVLTEADRPHLVLARVAGFDKAVFGLPEQRAPLLFEHPQPKILVATTKLSQFVTARYAPTAAWRPVWQMVLGWLRPGKPVPPLEWTPSVRPTYGRDEPLPADASRRAIARGAAWYEQSRMLVHPSWRDAWDDVGGANVDRAPKNEKARDSRPGYDRPIGDGRLGILEGHISRIERDGTQPTRWLLRADCNAESALPLALAQGLAPSRRQRLVAENLLDFVYFNSPLQQGPRADPKNTAYGLLAWWCTYAQARGFGSYYSNDNAKALVATIGTAGLIGCDRWDEAVLRCILGHFRLTSPEGFCSIFPEQALEKRDWRYFAARHHIYPRAQHMAWISACYLWLYDKTKYRPLLDRAERGLRIMMERYPKAWELSNQQIQMERSRMLLALAWLVRVDDTAEHRAWINRMAGDLLAHQAPCGAIQEEVAVGLKSNAEYGSREMALAQSNQDPVADMLYVLPNVLVGLHEAARATGDAALARANDRLAEFLVRIQVRSESHPELDGAWFRAFDFGHWDYWAVNGDAGWGAWCTETGWAQSTIVAGLALREMNTTLWDLTAGSRIGTHFQKYRKLLAIDEAVAIADKAWSERK
jgi:hypothetical protein